MRDVSNYYGKYFEMVQLLNNGFIKNKRWIKSQNEIIWLNEYYFRINFELED